VAVGDELPEIVTDKANMLYESDVAATLTEIVAEEGATLPIGEVIARIGDAGDVKAGGGGAPAVADSESGDQDNPPESGDP
jgi:pyruvate/2-oxoglutarate dehydrogenase complex dihydrolipoamide acyltransferase (E2) component